MISEKEVKHIASLARLGITESEVKALQNDLSSVLAYAEKLKEVDTGDLEPVSHPLKIENVMRKDEVRNWPQKLLQGFLKVKSIF